MVVPGYSESLGSLFGSVLYCQASDANRPWVLQNQQGATLYTGPVAFGGSIQNASLLSNIFSRQDRNIISEYRGAVERLKEVFTREIEVD